MYAKINDKKRIVVISPGRNCANTIFLWWQSLQIQNYKNWIAIAVDDNSDDNTYELLCQYKESSDQLYVYSNDRCEGPLFNRISAMNMRLPNGSYLIKDDDIVIFHDLDDWFGSKYVFENTIKEYLYRDIWCTTSSCFQLSDFYTHQAGIYTDRQQLIETKGLQVYNVFSYYAFLFRKIPFNYFIDPVTNKLFEGCIDTVQSLSILHYAGPEHHQHQFFDGMQAVIYNNIRSITDDNRLGSEKLLEIGKRIYDNYIKYIVNEDY